MLLDVLCVHASLSGRVSDLCVFYCLKTKSGVGWGGGEGTELNFTNQKIYPEQRQQKLNQCVHSRREKSVGGGGIKGVRVLESGLDVAFLGKDTII